LKTALIKYLQRHNILALYLRSLRKLYLFLSFAIILIQSASCNRSTTAEEGRKHLRAMDSELIQITNKVSSTDAFKGLTALDNIANLPLPFRILISNDSLAIPVGFDFNLHKGCYRVSKKTGIAYFERVSDSLIVHFPLQTQFDTMAVFIITAFEESQTELQMMVPVKVNAILMARNIKLMTIDFEATIEHGFPSKMNLNMLFGQFSFEGKMSTKFRKKASSVSVNLNLSEDKKSLFKSKIISDVENSNQQTLVFNKKRMDFEIFPVQLQFSSRLDFSAISSTNFINDFNQQSTFKVKSNRGNLIGDIFLRDVSKKDRINVFIRFGDGTEENLEELIMTVERILNMKVI
jgi:hypothetical protein